MHISFGIDGCRAGWFYVECNGGELRYGVVSRLAELLERASEDATLCIDIPIGLRDDDGTPRECDKEARRCLGRPRASSVFPAPIRAILDIQPYAAALNQNRNITGKGLSQQAFAIAPKIREVDQLMNSCEKARRLVREVHPEICFWALAGRQPMLHRKKTREGHVERIALLEHVFPGGQELTAEAARAFRRNQVALDDIVDALVAAFVATRSDVDLLTLPEKPPRDAKGLPMEMVYCLPPASDPSMRVQIAGA